jgi:hypothetical protein
VIDGSDRAIEERRPHVSKSKQFVSWLLRQLSYIQSTPTSMEGLPATGLPPADKGGRMRLHGPKTYLKPTISQPTLAAIWTYLDTFGTGDFQVELAENAAMAVRFEDPRDHVLLLANFPMIMTATSGRRSTGRREAAGPGA